MVKIFYVFASSKACASWPKLSRETHTQIRWKKNFRNFEVKLFVWVTYFFPILCYSIIMCACVCVCVLDFFFSSIKCFRFWLFDVAFQAIVSISSCRDDIVIESPHDCDNSCTDLVVQFQNESKMLVCVCVCFAICILRFHNFRFKAAT